MPSPIKRLKPHTTIDEIGEDQHAVPGTCHGGSRPDFNTALRSLTAVYRFPSRTTNEGVSPWPRRHEASVCPDRNPVQLVLCNLC